MATWEDVRRLAADFAEAEDTGRGFFGRLRDSLGKSRRALTDQLAEAAFDTADDEAWERLEEALIAGDVGVPATAELVRRLEAADPKELTERVVDSWLLAAPKKLAAALTHPGTKRREPE